jgi:hypothetical protein
LQSPYFTSLIALASLSNDICFLIASPFLQHPIYYPTPTNQDEYAANSQFVTHLTSRVLGQMRGAPTPIDTSGFQTLLGLRDAYDQPSADDLFDGMFIYNSSARGKIAELRSALDAVEARLNTRREQQLGAEAKAEAEAEAEAEAAAAEAEAEVQQK